MEGFFLDDEGDSNSHGPTVKWFGENRNKAMIEICNITKKYDNFTCLEQVSLTIPDGIIYGLVGENGA